MRSSFKDELGNYHPITNLIYFAVAIMIPILFMHTVIIAVSFLCATVYYYAIRRGGFKAYMGIVFVMILSSLVNPLFSHRGRTILFYFPTGNAMTLESLIYGLTTGVMIGSIMLWVMALSNNMDSSKLISTVGKKAPTVATILALVFRFVPRYAEQAAKTRKVLAANEISTGNKLKDAANVFDITTTWALESSLETSYAMKARGYGNTKRSFYNRYKFKVKDALVIVASLVVMGLIVLVFAKGWMRQSFYPMVTKKDCMAVYIIYTAFCLIPVGINIGEYVRWQLLKRKI